MVWQEATLAPSGSAIAFSKSLDGGLTWSAPVRINTRPDVQAFTPSVEVLADGTIAVTHYDLRNNTPDPATLPTDYWFLHSHDGGATWSETRVTAGVVRQRAGARSPAGSSSATTSASRRPGGQFLSLFTKTEVTDPASEFAVSLTP